MAQYSAPWEKYLSDKSSNIYLGATKSFDAGSATPMTDLEKLQAREKSNSVIAQSLGVESTGKPSTGLLTKLIGALTYVGSAATSGFKEFAVDPMWQAAHALEKVVNKLPGATETPSFLQGISEASKQDAVKNADTYRVSLDQFKQNLNDRNFAVDIYPMLQYDKNASFGERAIKQVAGFGVDIASTGGTGTGIKAASVLGRAKYASGVEGFAKDIFTKFAGSGGKAANALNTADDFSTAVAAAQLSGRSRAVAGVFEDTFGKEVGQKLFNELPKEFKGGLQLAVRGKTIGNLNAGGYALEKVATKLGLEDLPKATDWAVTSYQNIKNVLRTDAIENTAVKAFTTKINSVLNKLGGQSAGAWQNFVHGVVNDAKQDDITALFNTYKYGAESIGKYREVRSALTKTTDELFSDLEKTRKVDQATYDRAIELMSNPAQLQKELLNGETSVAHELAQRGRSEYDRYHTLLVGAGYDVGFLDEYLPFMFVKEADNNKFAEALAAGPKNIPGAGYNPEKNRTVWLKNKKDPITKEDVLDEAGNVIRVPMTSEEIRKALIKSGNQAAADLIVTDPVIQLTAYAGNISRMLSNKQVLEDMAKLGILKKSNLLQIGIDTNNLSLALSQLRPKDFDNFMYTTMRNPKILEDYMTQLNDELINAYSRNDQVLIDVVEGKVGNIVNALKNTKKGLALKVSRLKGELKAAEEAGDDQAALDVLNQLEGIGSSRDFVATELKKLGVKNQRIVDQATTDATPLISAATLAGREGVTYQPIGTSELIKNKTFYLPKELENLHGSQAIVDMIDRELLLGTRDKGQLEKAFDMYTQFFRTSATFGKLSGFVLRNGYGGIQNAMEHGTIVEDVIASARLNQAIIHTEYGLRPFETLTRKDILSKRLEILSTKGSLSKEQTDMLRNEIEKYGYVRKNTLATLREDVLKEDLSTRSITGAKLKPVEAGKVATEPDQLTQWDAYLAMKKLGVFDEYHILPTTSNLDPDNVAEFLHKDPSKIVLRTDVAGDARSRTQKIMEGTINAGVDIKVTGLGREFKFRPIQANRDANKAMESFVRGSAIITGLRKYGNSEGGINASGLLMKASQFDYSDLSDFERNIMRKAIPFYTYMRKNLGAQSRLLMNDPARIAASLKGWDLVKNIFTDESGNTYVLPDYIGQMYGFTIDDKLRKSLMEKSPFWLKPMLSLPIAFTPESPAFDIEKFTKGGIGGVTQNILSSSNPLAKEVLQYALNENLFKGKKYSSSGVVAPSFVIGLDKVLTTLTGEPSGLAWKDPNSGEIMTSEKNLDVFRTLLPLAGTTERTILPVIDAGILALTGKDANLAGSFNEKGVTSLVSQFLGLATSTITPGVEIGTIYNRNQTIQDNIKHVAGDQNVDIQKIREYANNLLAQGYTQDQAVKELIAVQKSGQFAPDIVG